MPEAECWLHPAVRVRASAIAGEGLFAADDIPAGTALSRLGGRLVTGQELQQLLTESTTYVDTITVFDDSHLVLPPAQPNGKGNHSCDPNLWWDEPYTLVTRRAVHAGEELTNDYATSTADHDFTMVCRCPAMTCRDLITGDDWHRPDLRERYGNHWVPALLHRIDLDPGKKKRR
ncbi:SET domain-containing protein [Winogradskya humida]|uniref:SET domain-containing protein n=1 Tax=Winogradskya humida TaxID=113566 RepID=UPI001940D8B1|nr:SET domain-containing protein [Actinoplanes humidus]